MFVLMNLMSYCPQRACVLLFGMHQPSAPVQPAQSAIYPIANLALNPIAPLHVPTRLLMT